ncbi:D-glycero-beta-D-manno-heptose 1-phosphate adenylyltransferase [Actinomadura sp. HBU206391]|uniref:D-glycero-beta-D-manno-heptose 1-phosphate adenylyltransferase n=1 Tax=Actinomadura sp. HBU206391 TaxID=2731692 RepID=UPI00165079F7|nr:D-glycero-beta-D-manno-heptose 1-phosphate adenylyltransferase [Actinomadura sp. HBU206391]MBC6459808.1 D-glycero-beta-D-manno-heptose 1-phosphate adenylyltransferase [Actinomadura sp. HBU206391]
MRRGPLVVIGDTLLDIDLVGTIDRLCPDGPVPVIEDVREHARAGGAGLVATLATRLAGQKAVLITALGDDRYGERLRELLGRYADVVPMRLRGETARKTRVRAAGRSVVRIDEGDGRLVAGAVDEAVVAAVGAAAAVLVADYGRGVAGHRGLRRLLTELPPGVPIVYDPHPRGATPLRGARLVTPNRAEARAFARARPAGGGSYSLGQAAADARALVSRWRAAGVAVTLGEGGALLSVGEDIPFVVPAPALGDGMDACGAGDCFAAAAALALRDGCLLTEAVTEAVHSASAFVASGGPRGALARTADLGHEAGRDAWDVVRAVRERGGKIVAAGGCFDLLHAGHVSLLCQARALGDCLVVCLNSDASVRSLKGAGRPVVGEEDRAQVLAALDSVDAVLIFADRAPGRLIERLRPDVWVKGGDYAPADLVEAETVRRYGGEVVLVPYLDGRSTSRLVERTRMSEPGGGGEAA